MHTRPVSPPVLSPGDDDLDLLITPHSCLTMLRRSLNLALTACETEAEGGSLARDRIRSTMGHRVGDRKAGSGLSCASQTADMNTLIVSGTREIQELREKIHMQNHQRQLQHKTSNGRAFRLNSMISPRRTNWR